MRIMKKIRGLICLNKKGSGMRISSEIVAEKAMGIIDQTKKNRESRHILTQMKVLYGNIENAVFAAELRCSDEFRCEGGDRCDFKKNGQCIVPKIRELLGEGVF